MGVKGSAFSPNKNGEQLSNAKRRFDENELPLFAVYPTFGVVIVWVEMPKVRKHSAAKVSALHSETAGHPRNRKNTLM
jgi:hypothetical protein